MKHTPAVAMTLLLLAPGCDSASQDNSGADGATGGDSASTGDTMGTGDAPDAVSPCGDTASLIPSWFSSFVPTKEIYASPSGKDSNDGSSPALAVQSAAAAFSHFAPGTRINFAAGTYACDVAVTNFMGTATMPGVVRSSDGPRMAKFDCSKSVFDGWYFGMSHFIGIDGIELFGSPGHGIHMDTGGGPWTLGNLSGNLVLINSFIHDTGYASIKGGSVDGFDVIDNELTSAGMAAPGSMNVELVSGFNVIIAGNNVHDSTGPIDEVKGGGRHALIYRNYIHDTNAGIMAGGDQTGWQFVIDPSTDFEVDDMLVSDNLIVNANAFAFRVVGCHNCTLTNNTFYATMSGATVLRPQTDCFLALDGGCPAVHLKNVVIENNVFAAVPGFGYVITGGGAEVAGFTMNHNLWWSGAGPVGAAGADSPFTGEPTSIYDKDPKLASPPTDLHPAPGSPVIGAGVPVSGVGGNYDGKCWTTVNIGAL